MKNIIKIIGLAVLITAVSCKTDSARNYQYMPNMYVSVGYEAYGEYEVFGANRQEAMQPVEGTISRGWMPYGFENSTEGYQSAKSSLKNPLKYTQENEAAGAELYTVYCSICHGDKGNGKGWLVQQEKILGVPSYDDVGRAITEGSIYHVMHYGINIMGSYASQTDENERWQIVQYVQKLKAELEGKTPRIDGDEASMKQTDSLTVAPEVVEESDTQERAAH